MYFLSEFYVIGATELFKNRFPIAFCTDSDNQSQSVNLVGFRLGHAYSVC